DAVLSWDMRYNRAAYRHVKASASDPMAHGYRGVHRAVLPRLHCNQDAVGQRSVFVDVEHGQCTARVRALRRQVSVWRRYRLRDLLCNVGVSGGHILCLVCADGVLFWRGPVAVPASGAGVSKAAEHVRRRVDRCGSCAVSRTIGEHAAAKGLSAADDKVRDACLHDGWVCHRQRVDAPGLHRAG
ncbi:hypothetical protein IWW55_005756, partial [Coemansia sp. RSA 2706]